MEVEPYTLPLSEPLATAAGRIDRRRGFVVRVADGPVQGLGEAAPLAGFTESVESCRRALSDAVSVAERRGLQAARDTVDPDVHPAAAHGVGLAILDAAARKLSQPLHRLFADRSRQSIPVNATVGDADRETTTAAAAEAVAAGYECVKVKVGARSVETDLDRVRAVRERVGDDVTLRADANAAWSRSEAQRAVEGLEGCGLEYLEQPLAAGDLTGHATLRTADVPIALDESLVEYSIDAVSAADAADAVVCKPMVHGSPIAGRDVAVRARRADLQVTITTTIDAVVARTAAVHVAASLPDVAHCGLATADHLAADLGPDPAPVSDGLIQVPTGPGLGIGRVTP